MYLPLPTCDLHDYGKKIATFLYFSIRSIEQRYAVLITEDDWNALHETLNSIPGMTASLQKGMATPLAECVAEKDVSW